MNQVYASVLVVAYWIEHNVVLNWVFPSSYLNVNICLQLPYNLQLNIGADLAPYVMTYDKWHIESDNFMQEFNSLPWRIFR